MHDLTHPAAAVTAAAGRWDIYGPVHKGLRLGHAALIRRLGSADWAAPQPELLADLRAHLALAEQHLRHEEAHIHPALDARVPGAAGALEEDHEAHKARFAFLEAQVRALEVACAADRPALGRALYLGFCRMVGEDLAHMDAEETSIWPRLSAHFTDRELKEIEMEIIASLPPQDVIAFMRLMIPAMNPDERAGLLGGMQAEAPAEAFAAVMELAARATLTEGEMEELGQRGVG